MAEWKLYQIFSQSLLEPDTISKQCFKNVVFTSLRLQMDNYETLGQAAGVIVRSHVYSVRRVL